MVQELHVRSFLLLASPLLNCLRFCRCSNYLTVIQDHFYNASYTNFFVRAIHEQFYGSVAPNHDLWTASFIRHYKHVAATIPAERLLSLQLESFAQQVCFALSEDECLTPSAV